MTHTSSNVRKQNSVRFVLFTGVNHDLVSRCIRLLQLGYISVVCFVVVTDYFSLLDCYRLFQSVGLLPIISVFVGLLPIISVCWIVADYFPVLDIFCPILLVLLGYFVAD